MKRDLALYLVSEVILDIGIGLFQYAQPFYYVAHGASDAMVGFQFALNALCGGVGALLFGPVADYIGASKVWKATSFGLALGYLITALTHTVLLWSVGSIVTGLSAALLMSTENVVLKTLSSDREMASVLSKFVALYSFVIGAGSVASGWVSAASGYGTAVVVGALVTLAAMPIRLFTKGRDTKTHTAFRRPSRRILAMSGYACMFGIGMALVNQFATIIIHRQLGMSTHGTAIVAAGGTFMVSLGSLFVSALLRKFRRNSTLGLSYVATIGLTLGLTFFRNPGAYSALYLARTATTSIPGPIVDAAFLELTPVTDFSQMFGVRVFGTNVGTSVGSFAGGALVGARALGWLAVLSAAVFVAAGVYLIVLLRRISQVPGQPAYAMQRETDATSL